MSSGFDPTGVHAFVAHLMADATPEQQHALLEGLMSGRGMNSYVMAEPRPALRLLPVPSKVRGFRVRLDLKGAKPPVWRRLDLPGDLLLSRVHDVIQASMGWHNSHLHRFTTSNDPRAEYFLTQFDLDEGDEGTSEGDVRLDQVLAAKGDQLFYDYDFGDGWHHVIKVESVLDEPPTISRCITGKMACPPEDCGGIWGYGELAAWVRGGHDDALLPGVFDSAEDAHEWLPFEWHPDHFDVDEVNAALAVALAEPVAVADDLAALLAHMDRRGIRLLREVLGSPMSYGPTDVPDAEAARITEPFRILLEEIGSGAKLTAAGYLPPAVVEQIAVRTGITAWWIGKANREDLTPPVAAIRRVARALGLVHVRDGHLRATRAGMQGRRDPQRLVRHIIDRLPLGTKEWERQSGWMALAVAASGTPVEHWRDEISDLMLALGWRSVGDQFEPPSATSATLDVLLQLVGESRLHWREIKGVDFAVAALARAVVRAD